MGRINSGHTLAQAIFLKSNQNDVSSKTLNKLSEKILAVVNGGDKQITLKTLEQALRHVDSLKNTPAQEKMQKLLFDRYPGAALTFAEESLELNEQPGVLLSCADIRLMSSMIVAQRELHPKIKLNMFRSVDDLVRFVMKQAGPYQGQAVVSMARSDEQHEPHFAAVDIRVSPEGFRSMVVYDSGILQRNRELGVAHGYKSLVEGIRFLEKRLNVLINQVGFVEIGAQKSPSDCGVFALNTAIQNFKDESVTKWLIGKMDANKQVMTRFYDTSAFGYIRDKHLKVGVTLPPKYHKHDHSISTLKKMGDGSVNKRGESVSQRAEYFAVKRDGRVYSNSIEHKRIGYYQDVVGQLKKGK